MHAGSPDSDKSALGDAFPAQDVAHLSIRDLDISPFFSSLVLFCSLPLFVDIMTLDMDFLPHCCST